jgi:predicted membrane-bound dolichyl-phosphate-mannose-protein mannosyltransferase
MKRVLYVVAIVAAALAVGVGVGLNAAGKSYQFTGSVTAASAGVLTVQKSASEVWTFSTDKDTKGAAKVGDKVTVYYNMIATEIESKPAGPAAKK